MADLERCAGCGVMARQHPWVGVTHIDKVGDIGEPLDNPSERGFVSVPVCDACHKDPAHRVAALACHFFPRTQAASAVRMAGSNAIG